MNQRSTCFILVSLSYPDPSSSTCCTPTFPRDYSEITLRLPWDIPEITLIFPWDNLDIALIKYLKYHENTLIYPEITLRLPKITVILHQTWKKTINSHMQKFERKENSGKSAGNKAQEIL